MSLGAWESYLTAHCSIGKCKRCFFFSKMAITTTSLILHAAPMWTNNIPIVQEKDKFTPIQHVTTLYSHSSRWLLLTRKFCLGPRCTYYSSIANELQGGTSLGRRHILVRFQIWDHCWIPQPKLHGAMYLIFFVKLKNGLVWPVFAFFLFFVSVFNLASIF